MKNTAVTFREAKQKGEKLTMLTAYDYSTAKLIDEAGVNAILVGDSLGMVMPSLFAASSLALCCYNFLCVNVTQYTAT